MQDYALKMAKAVKQEGRKNRNGLIFIIGIIRKQEPMTVEALDGAAVFTEGDNLTLTEGMKNKMISDPERREYIGRRAIIIGLSEMVTFDVLE